MGARDVRLRPTGTLRAALFFVDFADAPASGTTRDHEAHLLPEGVEMLEAFSYGQIVIEVTVTDGWHRMPRPSTDYGFQRGLTFGEHRMYVADAVSSADAAVDFSQFDIVYVMPTRDATAIEFSPGFAPIASDLGVQADGRTIVNAVTFGQDVWHAGWGHNVLAHETGHLFDLPDLYAFSGRPHRFVGEWDLMGQYASGPEFLAWQRWKLGWIASDQMRCLTETATGTVTLSPVTRPGGIKFAAVRLDADRYVVVESRRREGYDSGVSLEGVLVYVVDISVPTGEGPIRLLSGPSTASTGVLLSGGELVDSSGRVTVTFHDSVDAGDIVSLNLR